jgi:uncharacterized membrane protein
LWALAHLLSNGMLADVVLFGGFLAWAVADRISLKRRPVRAIKTAPAGAYNDWIAVFAGLALYGLFVVWAHAALTGIALLSLIPHRSLCEVATDCNQLDPVRVHGQHLQIAGR